MTQWQQKGFEAQVITKLATSTANLTLKQLGVPRCIIQSLRLAGYDIISVLGRYNSGYNLSKSSKSNCINDMVLIPISHFNLITFNYSKSFSKKYCHLIVTRHKERLQTRINTGFVSHI